MMMMKFDEGWLGVKTGEPTAAAATATAAMRWYLAAPNVEHVWISSELLARLKFTDLTNQPDNFTDAAGDDTKCNSTGVDVPFSVLKR